MKKIKRILYVMIVISLTVCSVPFSVEAASTVPVIISPVMYEEVVPYTNLTIRWTAPTSGTVSYYVLDIYKMAQSKYGQDYIYMNSEYAYENSFLFPAIALDYGEGYRISLRAVMSDDTVRYADEVHFFSGVSKGIASGLYPFGKVINVGETGRRSMQILRTDYEAWKDAYVLGKTKVTPPVESHIEHSPTSYSGKQLISTHTYTQEDDETVWEITIRRWSKSAK